jgi:NAD(P)-dependent dehydrogenase (short-subunit alcohol dehydrogenase family)
MWLRPDCKGKVALITGGSFGIGAAIAAEFVRLGGDVILVARHKAELEQVAAKLRPSGARALTVEGDVRSDDVLASAVQLARQELGRLDWVFANAGWSVYGDFESLDLADYERQFAVNVFGVMRTIKAALPDLKASRGRIVVTGSVSGHVCFPGRSAYAMSKFAVRALALTLAAELHPAGVSVTLATPGYVATATRQMDRQGNRDPSAKDPAPAALLLDPREAARQIIRAASRRKLEVVITWHGRVLVFLQRMFPELITNVLRKTGLREAKART